MNTDEAISYKCIKCGLESSVKEAFMLKKSLFGTQKAMCFECQQKKTMNEQVLQIALFLAAAVLFSLIAPDYWLSQLFWLILAGILIQVPFTLLHELAHAGMGRLLGFRIFAIHLGMGPILYSARFLGLQWVLHLLPLSGMAFLAAPAMPAYRLRRFLMILAGPAVHVLVAGGMLFLAPLFIGRNTDATFLELYYITIGVNWVLLAVSLFPSKSAVSFGIAESDGLALLKLPGLRPKELQTHYALYYLMGAINAIEQHSYPAARQWTRQGLALHPGNPFLLNADGVIYNHTNEFEKARQAYLQVLASAELPGELKYVAMNNVAYANLLLEDPSLLEQADDYSAQAAKNSPWNPALLGTRGAVLVELGQVEAGLELLKTALKKSPKKYNKAQHACGIALGELKRGRPLDAQKYLDAARQFDPQCTQLERVAFKIENASTL
jgi:tetratricopeptide (TPR) repeat protein